MMNKQTKWMTILLTITLCIPLLTGCGEGKTDKNAAGEQWYSEEETEYIDNLEKVAVYQDGEPLAEGEIIDYTKDVKKIYDAKEYQTIYDYANGYSVKIPKGLTPNYDFARYVCRYESEDVVIVASVESGSNYASADEYYNGTVFVKLTDTVKTNNQISLEAVQRDVKLDNGYIMDLFRGSKQDMVEDYLANYSYVYLRENAQSTTYYRFMIKYKQGHRFVNTEKLIKESFQIIPVQGRCANNADYEYPEIPDYWNEETKAYYKYLCSTDTCQWGTYNYQNYGGLQRQHYFEEQTGGKADLVMSYVSMYTMDFDEEYAQAAYEEDKVTVLTIRMEDATGRGIAYPFNIVKGEWDYLYEALARKIRDFGHPVIIRMENEFNASWGVNAALTLGDADWYRDAWIHIYNIFRAQGVENAIFMSNPQSEYGVTNGEYGQKWMNKILYMPSKDYIQIIGLTAYDMAMNNGYSGPFSYMYEYVEANEVEFFSNWPWIIGEFGCAGPESGIDKAAWIEEMFETIDQFPNIKGAIWFDSADSYADGSLYHDFRLNAPVDAGLTFFNCIKEAKEKSITGAWSFK